MKQNWKNSEKSAKCSSIETTENLNLLDESFSHHFFTRFLHRSLFAIINPPHVSVCTFMINHIACSDRCLRIINDMQASLYEFYANEIFRFHSSSFNFKIFVHFLVHSFEKNSLFHLENKKLPFLMLETFIDNLNIKQ